MHVCSKGVRHGICLFETDVSLCACSKGVDHSVCLSATNQREGLYSETVGMAAPAVSHSRKRDEPETT